MGWELPRKQLVAKYQNKLCSLGLSKEILENLYWEKGKSIRELSVMFPGIGIRGLMRKWDIPQRAPGVEFHRTKMKQLQAKGITKELLEDLYLNQKLSGREIDKRLDCMAGYYLKAFGIPRRKRTDHNNWRIRLPGTGEKISAKQKARFANPLERQKVSFQMRERIANGWRPTLPKRPNKQELKLLELLHRFFPNEYIYTGKGDGLTVISGDHLLIPDFVHQSKPKVIELFGNYWHTEKAQCQAHLVEPGRIEMFLKASYDCLVIWENELKKPEEELVSLIQIFSEREIPEYLPLKQFFLDGDPEADSFSRAVYESIVRGG